MRATGKFSTNIAKFTCRYRRHNFRKRATITSHNKYIQKFRLTRWVLHCQMHCFTFQREKILLLRCKSRYIFVNSCKNLARMFVISNLRWLQNAADGKMSTHMCYVISSKSSTFHYTQIIDILKLVISHLKLKKHSLFYDKLTRFTYRNLFNIFDKNLNFKDFEEVLLTQYIFKLMVQILLPSYRKKCTYF